MNAQPRLHRILGHSGFAAVLICSAGSLAATPPVDGDWKASSLVAAARLQETFYNSTTMSSRQGVNSSDFAQAGEEMVDTFFSGEFAAVGRSLTFSAGTLSGDVSGTYTLGTRGRVRLSVEGDSLTAYVNVSGDTMILPLAGENDLEATVVTRLPATLSHADLAGDWTVVGMKLPDDLTETYYNSVSETTRQGPASTDFAQTNETLVDVFFSSPPAMEIISFTLDAAGNITGDL
ncbi:MAG: hypothetical protein HKN82_00730, partial [Akkermansiaceae bacterium]|nr:hypothetical protein [Akkermansiaceae bacterium]